MNTVVKKNVARKIRHKKIRSRLAGDAKRPRLSVFKSNVVLYAQIIDDQKGQTLLSLSDHKQTGKTKTERARAAGKKIAEMALKKNINVVLFDRGGYLFQGRVKAFAEAAKKAGLKL